MPAPLEVLAEVERLKMILLQRATGGVAQVSEYVDLRRKLISQPGVKDRLPKFLAASTTLDEFWAVISDKFGSYKERRAFLKDEFLPLITDLEGRSTAPSALSPSKKTTLRPIDSLFWLR